MAPWAPVLAHLRQQHHLDFCLYRPTTICRRIQRRMHYHGLKSAARYAERLATDAQESHQLYHDLLIGVTAFFRDKAVFEALARQVLPQLLKGCRAQAELRAWCAGCATGEEAYSLAILLHEQAARCGFSGHIRIFATDVHQESLKTASRGIYPETALEHLSEARLQGYFHPVGERCLKLSDTIRRMVVFAHHDVIANNPFRRMDLVSCRNLLIYLLPPAQARVMANLQAAVRPGGILLLGSSERLGPGTTGFEAVSAGQRLFRRQGRTTPRPPGRAATVDSPPPPLAGGTSPQHPAIRAATTLNAQLQHDYDSLLVRYMPPGVLVDEHGRALHYFGDADRYLKRLRGRANLDIGKQVHDRLAAPLRHVLRQALAQRETVASAPVRLDLHGAPRSVAVTAVALAEQGVPLRHVFVGFAETAADKTASTDAPAPNALTVDERRRMDELEQELNAVRDSLEISIEDLQSSNERLDLTNEELTATNEELQSTNEELKSVNEDMRTVNAELEARNRDLDLLNQDHENLLASIDVGTLFLDRQLRIRKFSAAMCRYVPVLPHDIGRPLVHLAWPGMDQDVLLADVRAVLAGDTAAEREYRLSDGTWLLNRTHPFRTPDGKLEGVVLTFTDITTMKTAEQQIARMNAELEATVAERTAELGRFFEVTLDLLCIAGTDGRFLRLSPAWSKVLGYPLDHLLSTPFMEYVHPDDRQDTLKAVADLSDQQTIRNFVNRYRCQDGSYRWLEWNSQPVGTRIYAAARDITERKRAEAALMEAQGRYRRVVDAAPWGMYFYELLENGDLCFCGANAAAQRLVNIDYSRIMGRTIQDAFPGLAATDIPDRYSQVARTGVTWHHTTVPYDHDGIRGVFEVTAFQTEPRRMVAAFMDVTDRRRAEDIIRESEARHRSLVEALPDMVFVLDRGAVFLDFQPGSEIPLLPPSQFLGKALPTVLPESVATPLMAAMERVFATGTTTVVEYELPLADGPHDYEARILRYSADNVMALVRDVTARKRAEELLRQRLHALSQPASDVSDLRIEELFDMEAIQTIQDAFAAATGVASIITDTTGRPLTRTSNFCRLCRDIIRKTDCGLRNCMHSAAVLGRPHPDGFLMQPCLSGGLMDGGTSICIGERHVANWLVGQVLDADADTEKLVGYARAIGADESEFRDALREVTRMSQAQFRKVCEALYLVARQLSALASHNVQQARHISERRRLESERERLVADLESKNRELENIVYVSSHDLRTPLVNLEGFGGILARTCGQVLATLNNPEASETVRQQALAALGERIPKCLHHISSSTRKMDSLVNGLLQVSRTGRVQLRPTQLNMNEVVEAVLRVHAFEIQELKATVSVTSLPACTGDPGQINQVLANLLSNALKYRHPDRAPAIAISGSREGHLFVYRVQDNGIGIPASAQERVWGLFTRVNPEGPVAGDGLGLALVKLIVERHHGRCWVESVTGKGSCFCFALPADGHTPTGA